MFRFHSYQSNCSVRNFFALLYLWPLHNALGIGGAPQLSAPLFANLEAHYTLDVSYITISACKDSYIQ